MRRPHRFRTFSAAALFTCAALTAPAGAQLPAGSAAPTASAAPGAPAGKASIEELFKKFGEAAKAGEWPKAYELMQEAYSQKQTYDVLGNLGTAELRLGKMRDAAEHLGHSLAIFPVVGKPEAKRVTEELFAKAVVNVGTIRLKVSPTQARVKVGDRAYGADDYREQVFVEPGDVLVSAGDVVGYASEQQSVHVDKGKTVDVAFALKTTAGAPTTSASASATASVAPTGTVAAPGPSLGILIAGGAVTLASLAAGIGLVVASGDKRTEADKLQASLVASGGKKACAAATPPPDCKAADDAYKARDLLGNVGGTLLLVGGAAGAATAIYAVVMQVRKTTTPVQAGVVVTHEGGALTIHGNF